MRSRITAIVIGAAVMIGGYAATQGGGGAPEGTANVWVDTSTGDNTCDYEASPIEYDSTKACSSFDAAWDAMSAGDTARVKNGDYGSQDITGDKASETCLIGESRSGVVLDGSDSELGGDFVCYENMTNDSGTSQGWTFRIQADNVTLRDFDMRGDFFSLEMLSGTNFTWDGGVLGEQGVYGLRTCAVNPGSGEPVQLNPGTSGHRLANLTVWPQAASSATGEGCPDGFHEEDFRISSSNTTIENVIFKDGTGVPGNGGSGKIFLSGSGVQNLVIRNVIFGHDVNDACCGIVQANVSGCTVTVAYVTYVGEGPTYGSCSVTNIHTLGPNATGVTDDGRLTASATTAIDQGETDTGSDYCTGALGSVDFEGDARPVGSACDKGADEYTGG